ncbi:D-alanine--D-alanine ligase [Marinomonas sp. PE14-40]|uniref:D-alanine--D-alanine ligase n=1 Tax=Marinomonas sp. PE14-40 TaxID=3060621 RepID=UPI003F6671C7
MKTHSIPLPKGINEGMPPLEVSDNITSFFEFWPAWAMYTPVIIQWLLLSARYRSLSLPLIANPSIPLSGMVGESKSDILDLASEASSKSICQFTTYHRGEANTAEADASQALEKYYQKGLSLPLVAKPDLGCRGAGVRLINQEEQLVDYLKAFPLGAKLLLQERSQYQAEAGIFYIRYPGQRQGKIISITLKYTPWVIGDGVSTLKQLIMADKRAGKLSHIYLDRHADKLETVLAKDEAFRLAFAGSHSRGSIFRNGNEYITDALTQSLDTFFDGVPGYHFGRLDLKFKNIDDLMAGKNYQILEMNGASSEATHIWDSRTSLREAFQTLLKQYQILFKIGYLQRKEGHKPPSLLELYKAWQEEKRWVKDYPSTD